MTVLVVAILSYFVIGWVTVWIYYTVACFLPYVTNDNKYIIDFKDTERIMLAWPFTLPFVLLVIVFYLPYLLLIKFTPKGS